MPITLSVTSHRDAPPPLPLAHRFDRLGGSLGRAPGNDLVLDDPGKYISRIHARIEYRDGGYSLVDVGSNPSLVNERPVGAGRSVMLADGDRILLGDYQLVVGIEPEAAPAPAPLPPSPLQFEPAAPGAAPELQLNPEDSLARAGIFDVGGDPLNPSFDPLGLNLFGSPSPAAQSAANVPAWRGAESDHVPPQHLPFQAPPSQPLMQPAIQPAAQPMPATFAPPPVIPPAPAATPRMAIPDDYDPLADFLPPRVQPAAPPAPAPAPAFA